MKTKTARHERDCRICRHPQREEIERQFCEWVSASKLAKAYRLHRSTVYLHAGATGLAEQRQKNLKAALAAIIERGLHARVSAAVVVQAIVALSKLNEKGETVERLSVSSWNHFFDRFTRGELERFATTGALPSWYEDASTERVQ